MGIDEEEMEIIVARHSGFCYGVKKSYSLVDEYLNKSMMNGDKPVLNTYGDLIHNKQVVHDLGKRGAKSISSIDEIDADTVVIRAHGISPKIQAKLEELDIQLIDGTCQFVKNIHKLVQKYLSEGYDVLITGSREHPEVMGIVGNDEARCKVVENIEEARELQASDKKILIVSQTTFNVKKFEEISKILLQKFKNSKVHNTICGATHVNQSEAETLSKQVDCMIVVGGKHSSNTLKLYEIAQKNCKNSVHIENLAEIDVEKMQKYDKIGIVAGASTPKWVIDNVVAKLKSK